MLSQFRYKYWYILLTFFLVSIAIVTLPLHGQDSEKISEFGKYEGYSKDVYNSFIRQSQYVTMRDGIKLAVDILRPALEGQMDDDPLPCVWTHTRYRRANKRDGNVINMGRAPYVRALLNRGYVVCAVDVRGSGASFGVWNGLFTREETQDAYEVIEWIASQPWCDGNVGMFGGSYLGITQIMAASTKPKALKAIFPMVAYFNLYDFIYSGGVFYDDLTRTWSELTERLDTDEGAAPVDEDTDGSLLKSAVQGHHESRSLFEIISPLPFRDSRDPLTGSRPYFEWHPAGFIQEINESKVPMYLWCGWFDSFTRDGFQLYQNFAGPKKIVMGAWSHSPKNPKIQKMEFLPFSVEQIRWFDYWLKGIDNGIMDEPPIRYHLMDEDMKFQWRTALQWPVVESTPKKYYFAVGPSDSLASVNDGVLRLSPPSNPGGIDTYTVDYSTTSGTTTRWDNAVGEGFEYPDMTENDRKGLTYTTPALKSDLEITGHPVIHLWVSSTAKKGNFFAYLEEVDEKGFSHYVSEGVLKASHRSIQEAPYDNLQLPFHRGYEEDILELEPGIPAELVFDLHPTSNIFNTGNRIRITITCADKDNAFTEELIPAPTISVLRKTDKASHIILPVVKISPLEERKKYDFLMIVLIVLAVALLTIFMTIYLKKKSL